MLGIGREWIDLQGFSPGSKNAKEDMMTIIAFWIAVGAFVGWNVPQPRYAKAIQGWVVEKVRRIGK